MQHLDLSRVCEGSIARDERYGYLAIADHGWQPPWLDPERSSTLLSSQPPPSIHVFMRAGVTRVRIATELEFEVASGQLDPWQLKNLTREESGPE